MIFQRFRLLTGTLEYQVSLLGSKRIPIMYISTMYIQAAQHGGRTSATRCTWVIKETSQPLLLTIRNCCSSVALDCSCIRYSGYGSMYIMILWCTIIDIVAVIFSLTCLPNHCKSSVQCSCTCIGFQ